MSATIFLCGGDQMAMSIKGTDPVRVDAGARAASTDT